MSNKRLLNLGFLVLVAGVIIGLILATNFHSSEPHRPQSFSAANVVLGSQEEIPEKLLELQNTSEAFVYVSEKVVPNVVTIQSTRLVSSSDLQKFHEQEELRDFFRFRFPDEFKQQGSGSGIIVSEDGFILTNVHVVEKAEKVRVVLYDNREFEAQIVGLDPLTEVAVVKIDADNLPVAALGNSDDIRVGDWVLAVGNPLELRSTVTAGIISAKEREIHILDDTYSVENFLQTDAAINPGNSGGALVNLRGEVVGVNTAIATETGYSAGFGFAIPINLAKKIMLDLIHKGQVERGYLGIAMQNINEKRARALSLEKPMGVFIDRVLRDSPAGRAGLQSKDVILEIDGIKVNRSNQVQALIARRNPGETVPLHIMRDGREMTLDVTLGKKVVSEAGYTRHEEKPTFENLGLSIDELTRDAATAQDYSGPRGVIVQKVERFSPAEESGLIENDIIIKIDDQRIEDRDDFNSAISRLHTGAVAIFAVKRFNEEYHFFVEVP